MDDMHSEPYGEMIRRRRVAAGLSQEWLAEQAGTNRPHLSQIERGKIGTPQEPLRSTLLDALERAERDRGIPVEHELSAQGQITLGGEANLVIGAEADPWLRVVFSGAPKLSEAGKRALAEQFEYIRKLEEEYRREAERDAAPDRGEDRRTD